MHDFIMLISIMEFRFVDSSSSSQKYPVGKEISYSDEWLFNTVVHQTSGHVIYSFISFVNRYLEFYERGRTTYMLHIRMYAVTSAIINWTKSWTRVNLYLNRIKWYYTPTNTHINFLWRKITWQMLYRCIQI